MPLCEHIGAVKVITPSRLREGAWIETEAKREEAMSDNSFSGCQTLRPEWERKLPDWERAALDQRRNASMTNINQNPAIWEKLTEIERKLDHIFALLQSKS